MGREPQTARTHHGVRLQRLLSGNEDALDGGQYATVFRHTMQTMITVVICCPLCSQKTSFGSGRVDGEGYVRSAVKCENGACPFFEYLHLDGWAEPT